MEHSPNPHESQVKVCKGISLVKGMGISGKKLAGKKLADKNGESVWIFVVYKRWNAEHVDGSKLVYSVESNMYFSLAARKLY